MTKAYFEYLDPLGFLLVPFYSVMYIFFLHKILNIQGLNLPRYYIIYLFIYYIALFFFTSFFSLIPNLPDTVLFAKIISENYYPDYQSLGVKIFYFVTYPIRVVSLFKVELFILFQIFIFITSLIFIWKSFELVLVRNGINKETGLKVFFILSFLYPSFLLYIAVPLREFLILFGFSVLILGVSRSYNLGKGGGLIIVGTVILILARPQLVVVGMILFIIFQKNKHIRIALIAVGVFLVPLTFTSLTGYKFSPEFFSYLRNSANENYVESGFVYGKVIWNNYVDLIIDLPMLFFQFILSPLPIMHSVNPLALTSVFIDMIFCVFIYILALFSGFKLNKAFMFVFIFVLLSSIFSIWEFYITAAVRHRMPLVALILPLAAYSIVIYIRKIKRIKF